MISIWPHFIKDEHNSGSGGRLGRCRSILAVSTKHSGSNLILGETVVQRFDDTKTWESRKIVVGHSQGDAVFCRKRGNMRIHDKRIRLPNAAVLSVLVLLPLDP